MVHEKIFNTLQAYDPERTTITLGGAAIAVHFAEVGLDFSTEDVDVLCSAAFITGHCTQATSAEPDTVQKLQIRYPYGTSSARALSLILDIYPGEKTSDTILPFSASQALGGTWHPTYYTELQGQADKLTIYDGYKFLSMAEILLWTAITGRQKDLDKVDKLLPVSLDYQLISPAQHERVKAERDHSANLRHLFPDRHYARVA